MVNLIGTYQCKADVKGRLMLPIALKKQLGININESFILKRSVFQPCLELHPYSEWKLTMDKINTLNRFIKKNNDFIRMFTAGVRIVDLDNSGRILIPKDLLKTYFFKNDLVLTTAINIIEIWDKDSYENIINNPEIDFADLSEKVMGNKEEDVS
ncbi:MAG: division/cell wall cluster transcriptional repressor MraZ [Flavobacteriaceae bacterium]|nr:division/cell wall cluster transcriptional repressor MraZ [Pelagibacterales bacterium]MBT4709332.1 division/cell wall cluster transcriptional repressor MraZ [Flavobacteriaceae bacterium]MBT4959659.1 division/cell wall cluster transcriptional repressor MraZ [Flavobacteriaceae bacterium]MBT6447484.1 division/cell wall cluster transcriptional repressor MraZ [Flavobacteriaceae bacterium]MDG1831205.1 division/cell wall cluster transcriptional repressor MraZ [Flavobacteriaceae bacterium]